ncbi:MAG: hypothetical protein ACJ8AK_06270 [Gemmatimonadaceae bacterium]
MTIAHQRILRLAFTLGIASSLSGCRLLSCTYETRYVTANGAIIENGSQLVRADITVGANKGSLEWKDFNRTIAGPSLKGHVLAARLVRSDHPGVSLLDLPLDDPISPLISSGGFVQHPADASPNLNGLFEIVAGGLAAIELDTDISSQSHLSIPLNVTQKKDWYRPSNCY